MTKTRVTARRKEGCAQRQIYLTRPIARLSRSAAVKCGLRPDDAPQISVTTRKAATIEVFEYIDCEISTDAGGVSKLAGGESAGCASTSCCASWANDSSRVGKRTRFPARLTSNPGSSFAKRRRRWRAPRPTFRNVAAAWRLVVAADERRRRSSAASSAAVAADGRVRKVSAGFADDRLRQVARAPIRATASAQLRGVGLVLQTRAMRCSLVVGGDLSSQRVETVSQRCRAIANMRPPFELIRIRRRKQFIQFDRCELRAFEGVEIDVSQLEQLLE